MYKQGPNSYRIVSVWVFWTEDFDNKGISDDYLRFQKWKFYTHKLVPRWLVHTLNPGNNFALYYI